MKTVSLSYAKPEFYENFIEPPTRMGLWIKLD